MSGSAPLPATLHAAIERAVGQRVLERYGMTETLIGSKDHGRTLARHFRLSRWSALDALYVLGHALLREFGWPFRGETPAQAA